MITKVLHLALFLLHLSGIGWVEAQVDDNICIANSLNGPIRGKLILSATGKHVCGFYGIPFAKPPIGELRFKRPVPIENWENEFIATELPNSCTQGDGTGVNPKISEDCLILNIWAPLSIFNGSSNSAAVMVWIHGGALIVGSSIGQVWEHGTILAGDQEIVVASIQYRLGPLGFLYFGTDDAPGNMGLIDQSLGIKWVRDNIESFGGIKEEITIFGGSAGSISVSYHLLSPLSQNLFKRAILMSGAAIAPVLYRTHEESIQFSYEVAEHAGCFSQADDPPKGINEILSCMRTKDKYVLNFASYPPKFFMDFQAILTVDDYFLPDTPENLLNAPENSFVDIMIGNVQDEGTTFLLQTYPEDFNMLEHPSLSISEYEALFRDMFPNRPEFETDAIITRYTHWSNFNDGKQNALNLIAAVGDYLFVCPDFEFAQKWSNNGRKVYFYWFTHRASDPDPLWLGVFHGTETEYIFGGPILNASRPEHEKNLSRKIQELFVNFAKTGIPSDNWLDFTAARPVYLDLNATVISDVTPDNIYGPRGDECAFWNIELPRMRKLAEDNDGGGENCPSNAIIQSIHFVYLLLTLYLFI